MSMLGDAGFSADVVVTNTVPITPQQLCEAIAAGSCRRIIYTME
ncbi:hypothetical protein [Candidatus Poriferisodalis sp.]